MDIQFNILLSTLGGSNTPLQPNQLFLRLLSSLSGDEANYSPIVQKIREFKDKNEKFSKHLSKFLKKSKDTLVELNKDLEALDDDPVLVSLLKEQISNNQKNIHSSLSPIEHIIKQQISVVNRLSDHISPPTEELFTKKVNAILDKNPIQQVPSSKKNRCTICLDTDSNILIKRTCKPNTTTTTTTSSSSSSSSNTTTPTAPTTTSTTPTNNNSNTTSTTTTNSTPIGARLRSGQAAAAHFAQITQSISQSAPKKSNCFCEAAVCNCGPTMCQDCLIKHYWMSTSKGMKSFGKCVCCRSEFCLKDIYKVEYVNDDTNAQEKPKESLKVNDSKPSNSTTTAATSSSSPSPSKKRKDSDSSTGYGGSDNKRYKEQQSQINVKDEKVKTKATTTTTTTSTTSTTTTNSNNIFVCSNKPSPPKPKSKRNSGTKVQFNDADKNKQYNNNSSNNDNRNKKMDDKDKNYNNDPNSAKSREPNPFKNFIY